MSKFREALVNAFNGDEDYALQASAEVFGVRHEPPTWAEVEYRHAIKQRQDLIRRFNKVIRPGHDCMLPKTTTWSELNGAVLEQIKAGRPRVISIFPRVMRRNPEEGN